MQIIRATDYDHMSRMAANIISAQVIMKPDCVLGLATGSTPIGTYEQLIRWYEKETWIFPESEVSIWTNIRDFLRKMIKVIVIL